MKHIKLIAVAVTIIALNSGIAAADEIKLKAPDISSKLNTMVEDKMDGLVKKMDEDRGYLRITRKLYNELSLIPCSSANETAYNFKKAGS